MTNSESQRKTDRFQHPRMEVEWRVVDGGLYKTSKLLNFSSGGLAVRSERALSPNQRVAFRIRLGSSTEYVMGQVSHSREVADGRYLTGVSLEFPDHNQKRLYHRRVMDLKEPRRSTEICRL